jgi:hypothetical protein
VNSQQVVTHDVIESSTKGKLYHNYGFVCEKTTRASFTRAYNGLIHELSEREPNEKNVRTRFTTLERLAKSGK